MNLTPKWRIEMTERDGKHFYSKDGEATSCVGVTTILGVVDKSVALVPWASKCVAEYMAGMFLKLRNAGTKDHAINYELLIKRSKKQWKFERDKAGDLGTRFHELMEDSTKDIPKDLEIAMKSANLWLRNTKLRLVKGRTMVLSEKYNYGGEWDGLFQQENGEYVIVDFKSGKRLYDSAAAQCAAYGQGFQETFEGIRKTPKGLVVRFGKEKVEYEEKEVLNMNQSFEYFKACLGLYNLMPMKQFGQSKTVKGEQHDRRPRRIRSIKTEVSKT